MIFQFMIKISYPYADNALEVKLKAESVLMEYNSNTQYDVKYLYQGYANFAFLQINNNILKLNLIFIQLCKGN